jgi:hypothetical protein
MKFATGEIYLDLCAHHHAVIINTAAEMDIMCTHTYAV